MVKTDWELSTEPHGHAVIERYRTPLWLWLLDKWFRVPDALFDRIEWWLPVTSGASRIPCLLYSTWYPQNIERRELTVYDVEKRSDALDDGAVTGTAGKGTTT